MADVLFVTWDGGGNVPPALAIARELRRRGHAVRFLGHASQRPALTAAGFEVAPTRHAREFSSQRENPPITMLATVADRGLGRDLLAEVARRPADLVVVDCMTMGALHAAHAAGLRYAVLEHLYDGYFRRGILGGAMGLNLRLRRLRPQAAVAAAAARLVTSLPELDPLPAGPSNVRQVGPVVDVLPRSAGDGRTVLVSLSTYAYPGMQRTLQAVVDATAGLSARVVVTTGPVIDPAAVRARPGVEVHRYVPHGELMRSASLFVGHGGHGGTMAALAHDLPMVLVPMYDYADQPLVARSVERAGAARVVDRRASPERIAPVLTEMLDDGPHRAAAARLGAAVRALPGASNAADVVEELATRPPAHPRSP